MNRFHVVNEESGDGNFGKHGPEKLIIVQVVDDEVGYFDGGVGLNVEIFRVLQVGDGHIGQSRVQFLNGWMQHEVPVNNRQVKY